MQALREARRVIKPGGRFLCLEFSHLTNPMLQQFVSCSDLLLPRSLSRLCLLTPPPFPRPPLFLP